MRRYIETPDTGYGLVSISSKTLSKLLTGKFNTFEELNDFEDQQKSRNSNSNIRILYRTIEDNIKGELHIIETIFINE